MTLAVKSEEPSTAQPAAERSSEYSSNNAVQEKSQPQQSSDWDADGWDDMDDWGNMDVRDLFIRFHKEVLWHS